MRNCKKLLACLMALALLVAIPVASASAEIDTTLVVDEWVGHSITTEDATGNGLAFLFTMHVDNAIATADREFISAAVTVDGTTYAVSKMGAVLTNQVAHAIDMDNLTLEDVDNESVIDIPAKYVWDHSASQCSFAVRLIEIPAQCKGYAITCRPYLVLKDADGAETTVYGNGDLSSFNAVYYANNEDETPALNVSAIAGDGRIAVTAAADYVSIAPETYKEAFKVTLSMQKTAANASVVAGSWVQYTYYDAAGTALGTMHVDLEALNDGALDVEFYVPVSTASIQATAVNLDYLPIITLPTVGSDIDVAKKKDRIHVSATNASFNENGTIAVSLTFKNKTKNWITEETDWVEYTCYDADGNVVQSATKIYIGCIDTKKNPTKTFRFDVPANTAEVRLTNSKIVYWTEWA